MNIFASLKALFQPAGPVDGVVAHAPQDNCDAGFAAILAGMGEAPPLANTAATVAPPVETPVVGAAPAPDDAPVDAQVARQPEAGVPVDVAASLTRFVRRAGESTQPTVARPPLAKTDTPDLPVRAPVAAPAIERGEDEPASPAPVVAPSVDTEATPVQEQPLPTTAIADAPMAVGEDSPVEPPLDATQPVATTRQPAPPPADSAEPAASPADAPVAAPAAGEERPVELSFIAADPIAMSHEPTSTQPDPVEPAAQPVDAALPLETTAAQDSPVAGQPEACPATDTPASPVVQAVRLQSATMVHPLPEPVDAITILPVEPSTADAPPAPAAETPEPASAPLVHPLPTPVDQVVTAEPSIIVAPAAVAAQPVARPLRNAMPAHEASFADPLTAASKPPAMPPVASEGADEGDIEPADESPASAVDVSAPPLPPVPTTMIAPPILAVSPAVILQPAEAEQIASTAPVDSAAPAPLARASAAPRDPVAPAPVAPSPSAQGASLGFGVPAPEAPAPAATDAPPSSAASPLAAPAVAAAPAVRSADKPLPSGDPPVSSSQPSDTTPIAPQPAAAKERVSLPLAAPQAASMAVAPAGRADTQPLPLQTAMPRGDVPVVSLHPVAQPAPVAPSMADNMPAVVDRSPAPARPAVAPTPATDSVLRREDIVSAPATLVAGPVPVAQAAANPLPETASIKLAASPSVQNSAAPTVAPVIARAVAPATDAATVAPETASDGNPTEPPAPRPAVEPSVARPAAPIPARPVQPTALAEAQASAPAPLPVIDLKVPAAATPPVADAAVAMLIPETSEQPTEKPALQAQPSPVREPGPIRSEVVSLLQLVRDRMSGRTAAPATPAPVTAAPVAEKAVAPVDSARSATVDAAPIPAMLVAPQHFAVTAPVAITPAAPTPDLNAVLTGQAVAMGLDGQWIDGLARDIAGLAKDGAQGRFQINSAQLGPVDIAIRQGGDGAQVTLAVASEAAEAALKQDSDRLRADSALSAVRIVDVKVERLTTSASDAPRGDQSSGQQSLSQQQGGSNQGHNAQSLGQGMGQGGQNRAHGQENLVAAHKAALDPAVINHGEGDEAGDMARITGRARYA